MCHIHSMRRCNLFRCLLLCRTRAPSLAPSDTYKGKDPISYAQQQPA